MPLQLISDDSVYEYEKSHLPEGTWPPTSWYADWVSGLDVFDLRREDCPIEMRWLVYQKPTWEPSLASGVAKLELSRKLSLPPEDAWAHASNLSELGDWLVMHQGWRGQLPTELTPGATLVGVAGAKGLRNRVTWTVRDVEPPRLLEMTGDGVGGTKYALTMTVSPTASGCEFTVKIDLGGRPLFGPIGAVAARAVRGDIERSIQRFEALYS